MVKAGGRQEGEKKKVGKCSQGWMVARETKTQEGWKEQVEVRPRGTAGWEARCGHQHSREERVALRVWVVRAGTLGTCFLSHRRPHLVAFHPTLVC